LLDTGSCAGLRDEDLDPGWQGRHEALNFNWSSRMDQFIPCRRWDDNLTKELRQERLTSDEGKVLRGEVSETTIIRPTLYRAAHDPAPRRPRCAGGRPVFP
jgi:hypothetical protein